MISPQYVDGLELRIRELTQQLAAKQARIDELMLEYCPNEMTEEQLEEWSKHQRTVKESK